MNSYFIFLLFTFISTVIVSFLLEKSSEMKPIKIVNMNLDPYVVIVLSFLGCSIAGDFILIVGYFYSFLPRIFHPETFPEYIGAGFVWSAIVFQGMFLNCVVD